MKDRFGREILGDIQREAAARWRAYNGQMFHRVYHCNGEE